MADGYELEPIARAICARENFEYISPVGQGAFKETYKARQRDVFHALKVYRPGGGDLARIQREIEAMVRCNHPNIARLRKVDSITTADDGECLFSLEEFLAGGTLASRTKQSALSRSEALAMGDLLVSAVAHIAERDLVHRDIKPENIMLRDDGQTPVIVDFGLVRPLGLSSLTASWIPHGPGTPYYAPPEQLCNDKSLIDWRADQFSLGVSLAFAVLRRHPYGGGPAPDVVQRVAARTSVPSQFVADATSLRLPALVRMIAPWPIQRYRTPRELALAWRAQRGDR